MYASCLLAVAVNNCVYKAAVEHEHAQMNTEKLDCSNKPSKTCHFDVS